MMTCTNVRTANLSRLAWRKSSYSSAQGNCVEVATLPGGHTAVRDSRRRTGPALVVTSAAWHAFRDEIKMGKLDQL
jgi:Domain of unknown function (DUF397)